MFRKRSNHGHLYIGLVVAMLVAAGIACDEEAVGPSRLHDYKIQGALIIDPNLQSTLVSKSFKIALRLTQDGAIPDSGEVMFAERSLLFRDSHWDLDSIYSLADNSTFAYTNSTQDLELHDGGSLSKAISVVVPDSFSITNLTPGNHQIEGLGSVSMEWSGSTKAEAYVLAVTPIDSAYSGYGFSMYASDQVTSGTIPPEAFSLTDGLNPDLGLYILCLYALAGSPDSILTNALLPVPLPSQLTDNIAETNLSGRFGAVFVTLYDTVRVVQQQ